MSSELCRGRSRFIETARSSIQTAIKEGRNIDKYSKISTPRRLSVKFGIPGLTQFRGTSRSSVTLPWLDLQFIVFLIHLRMHLASSQTGFAYIGNERERERERERGREWKSQRMVRWFTYTEKHVPRTCTRAEHWLRLQFGPRWRKWLTVREKTDQKN